MTAPGSETVLALTTSRLEPYEYQPLSTPDSIRVLCLEPAKTKDTPLRGNIVQYDRFAELAKVHSRRKYCAVSYVWGTPEFTEHLEITDPNRTGRSTKLSITLGVKTMLQHFRKPDKKQHLWIDAICLNQSDRMEKTNQIPLMGEIYAQAYKSKFWLGVEDGLKAAKIFAYFRCSASMPTSAILEQNLPFPNHEEFASQVKKLLRRTWFSRRWILQEARLSRNATMWCGDHSIPYHVFVTACKNIVNGRYKMETCLYNEYAVQCTYQINSLVSDQDLSEDMGTLLWNFHESACSEEKDRFGALYGLIPRDSQPKLDLAAPYQRLFQQFAVEEVNESSASAHRLIVHLDSFGSLNRYKQFNTSSWVPDWSQKRNELRKHFCIHTVSHAGLPFVPVLDTRRIKCSTSADPQMISHHQWHRYLKWRVLAAITDSSYTYLSAYYDTDANGCSTGTPNQNAEAVLRVRWDHPHAGKWGMTIVSVVTVPNLLSEEIIPVEFLQKLQPFINGRARLHSFVKLIRDTLFPNDSEDPHKTKEALINCFTALSGITWSEMSNTGHCHISNLVEGMLVHRIAKFLYSNSLSILEGKNCDASGQIMYALGPPDVNQNDCMIPLACRPWGQLKRGEDTAWVRYGSYHRFENMMAVRPCDPPNEFQSAHQGSTAKTTMGLRARRGTFVGLCLAYFPFEEPGREEDQKGRFRAETILREMETAEIHGEPMPYVFDII